MTIACSDCGTLQDLPPLQRGATLVCPVCRSRLERTAGRSLIAALACAIATFLLLFPANLLPLMQVSMLGMSRGSRIYSGVARLWEHHWVIPAILVALFVMILPLLRFGLLSMVLALLRLGRRPHWLGRGYRWAMHLDSWAMPDVFLLGAAVGYSRVAANLPVTVMPGGFCLIGAALGCMLTRVSLDRRTVWRAIGMEQEPPAHAVGAISCAACELVLPEDQLLTPCPRCGLRLRARKPVSMMRTLALVIAGFVLYFPANLYPMSTDLQMGTHVSHRIIDGILDLFGAGLWPLGVLIFCTSVAIPLLKLAGLSWFMFSVKRASRKRLVLKTSLHRFIDEIGRWSNLDVFTVAVFVPVLQFDSLASADAAPGSTAFILVVVLTMIASQVFDPRLMWDAALEFRGG
ncbi:MAG: paraquat-inducible protein A [Proteobacteria bacterium]|nr:paraquat-inducible protein A [Pseudomonadota bacterium]